MTDSSAAVLPNIHQFTMTRIDGHEQPLSEYKGKVVLVVNTASECGLTPQYEGLQALYEQYHDQGFEILGFPANNFGGQEPGTDAEIAEFCTANYSVTFPMFSKIEVIGDQQHPLYAELSRIEGGEPSWNFTKYLIGKDGSVLVRFDPRTPPNDSELTSALVRAVEK
ncbi:MAG: glutathione peroxidase [Phycisphaeraceae bacterium]|nr:glutathione peroxidase [Phycisphaerales bacterium]MCB9860692.1 glutathione peroxidase [Phycisphaeraceae bacterium]